MQGELNLARRRRRRRRFRRRRHRSIDPWLHAWVPIYAWWM